MPTADRTTLRATVEALTSLLRDNLVADPPTADRPFRRIEPTGEYARPFATLTLEQARPVGVVDNDRLFEASITIRIVADVAGADPLVALLDKVAAMEDHFDDIVEVGVIDGSAGFDDRLWRFDYAKASAGYRVATATATQRFIVRVERSYNRTPAV